MEQLLTADNLVALFTLTAMEIVLGIDNIVFIAILAGKLPPEQQKRARQIGLFLAMFVRIALLLSISWVMSLTKPIFTIGFLMPDATEPAGATVEQLEEFRHGVRHMIEVAQISGRDIILLVGGLFLVAKATFEIHGKIEGHEHEGGKARKKPSFTSTIIQIIILDIVFSLDSVITAVGMAKSIYVMVAAVIIAVGAMLVFAGRISGFIERHPTLKMLALSFLILIGVMLVADSFAQHIPKGYIYVAMAFSLGVEMLNMRVRGTGPKVVSATSVAKG
ncbi:MAG: TerC family protein [Phycisphaerales bacterium]|nr:TerC family protein [Phycisphaerales bacterium]